MVWPLSLPSIMHEPKLQSWLLCRQRSGVGARGLASQPSAGTRDMQRGLSSLLRQTASGQIAADLLAAPEARRASPALAERAPRGAHRSHRAWGSSGSLAQDNRWAAHPRLGSTP